MVSSSTGASARSPGGRGERPGHAPGAGVLIATGSFGPQLPASRVAGALARGLHAAGMPTPDLAPMASPRRRGSRLNELLDALAFDARMRGARALIIGERRLHKRTLADSVAFELATRARQAGVPAYGVTAENRLDLFDARMLDLQAIVQAADERALARAARRLATLI